MGKWERLYKISIHEPKKRTPAVDIIYSLASGNGKRVWLGVEEKRSDNAVWYVDCTFAFPCRYDGEIKKTNSYLRPRQTIES